MAEYLTRDSVEVVNLNFPITFLDSLPCTSGCVYHKSGTGVFILKGKTSNCFARYRVEFTGNIAIPTGGEISPIGTAITVNGEEREGSRSITTPTVVDSYGNVTSRAVIDVPRGCCYFISLRHVAASTDPTVTPAPVVTIQNGNFRINRIA